MALHRYGHALTWAVPIITVVMKNSCVEVSCSFVILYLWCVKKLYAPYEI